MEKIDMGFYELESNETTIEEQLSKTFMDDEIEVIDIKKFYPEFNFKDVYGLQSNRIAISKYFLTFEQVIVKVPPLQSLKEFNIHHGIEFSEFIELVRRGKILPLICFPYPDFPDFYSDLFSIGPFPRTGRLRAYFARKTNSNKENLIESIKKLSENRKLSNSIEKYFSNFHGDKKALFINSFSSDLFDLKILGLNDVVDIILDIAELDPSFGHQIAFDFSELLLRPLFENLQGINSFSNEDIKKARSLYLKAEDIRTKAIKGRASKHLLNRVENFMGINPAELIKFIDKGLSISIISAIIHQQPSVILGGSANNSIGI